jgi:Tfp pilus assembly protein PilZ
MRNRRKNPRVRARGLAVHINAAGQRHPCVVENISLGGMFVRTDRLEHVGTGVAVLLVKPGWKKQLSLTARITSRIDGIAGKARVPGLGLQFTALDGDAHDRLRSLLHQLGAPDDQAEVPVPDDSIAAELRPLPPEAPVARPVRPMPPRSAPPPPPPSESDGSIPVENARLKLQLRGLAMQLSDAQQLVVERDAEIERLREQLDQARAALQRAIRGE